MITSSNTKRTGAKKLAVLFSLIWFSMTMTAQTERGTVSFGLHNFSPSGLNVDGMPLNLFGKGTTIGLSWGRSKSIKNGEVQNDGQSQYTLGLNLCSHYFIAKIFSVGVVGSFFTGFSAYAKEGNNDGRYSARILLAGPEVRYYLGTGKTKAWLKASGSMGGLNVWWNGQKDKPSKFSQVAAGAGVSFFLSKKVSMDLGLEYNIFTMKMNENEKGVNSNLAIDLGFGLFF